MTAPAKSPRLGGAGRAASEREALSPGPGNPGRVAGNRMAGGDLVGGVAVSGSAAQSFSRVARGVRAWGPKMRASCARQARVSASSADGRALLGVDPEKAEQRRTAGGGGGVMHLGHRPHHALRGSRQARLAPEGALVERQELGVRRHPGRQFAPQPRRRRLNLGRERHGRRKQARRRRRDCSLRDKRLHRAVGARESSVRRPRWRAPSPSRARPI